MRAIHKQEEQENEGARSISPIEFERNHSVSILI